MDLKKYENELYQNNYQYIGGVDEAGRGPLAGPVVAACVVLPKDFELEGLTDSKKLSEKKRDTFFEIIMKEALGVGVGIISPQEIDKLNIYQASKVAMIKAIKAVNYQIDYLLIDAMPLELETPSLSIIKGDAKSLSIAAASVIAKVTRDKIMYDLDIKYPEYGFKKHKGYPTKAHIEALNKYGIKDFYRMTYGPVKDLLAKDKLKV